MSGLVCHVQAAPKRGGTSWQAVCVTLRRGLASGDIHRREQCVLPFDTHGVRTISFTYIVLVATELSL
jgi:hypothetical protein